MEKIRIGEEIINLWGTKGVVIETIPQADQSLAYSVLWWNAERKCFMRNDWPSYEVRKEKTGRFFPQLQKKLTEDAMEEQSNTEHEKYEKDVADYLRGINKERVIEQYLQVKWERDVAVSQLEELGYQLGEKPRQNADAISRREILAFLQGLISDDKEREKAVAYIKDMPAE